MSADDGSQFASGTQFFDKDIGKQRLCYQMKTNIMIQGIY